MFLPDINFWLALTFESHFHHAAAKTWFDALPEAEVGVFCRLTQQGFLRLATNRKAFGDEAVTLIDAWLLYDALQADPRVDFVEEPIGIERFWRDYTSQASHSTNVWSDAYLAAFARAGECTLVTFDGGFVQFADLDHTILS